MEFGIAGSAVSAAVRVAAVGVSLLINLGENTLACFGQFFGSLNHSVVIVGVKFFFGDFKFFFEFCFVFRGKFIPYVFHRFFDGKDKPVEFIVVIYRFLTFFIFFFVLFRFVYRFIDIRFGKVRRRSNRNVLRFTRSEIFRGNVYDTVSVYIEGNFYLRNSPGSGRDAYQVEVAERFVIFREFSFTL